VLGVRVPGAIEQVIIGGYLGGGSLGAAVGDPS
jgi:hypothetical protein